jgi:hypothetical protein
MWQVPGSNLDPEMTGYAEMFEIFHVFSKQMLKYCPKTALSLFFSYPSEYMIHNDIPFNAS